MRVTDGANEFVLVEAAYSATGEDIVITEADVDNVIRAKAAIFAGIKTLLESVALDWADLEQIFVAGGFGKYLRIEQAMSIGLFPEVDVDKFTVRGQRLPAGGPPGLVLQGHAEGRRQSGAHDDQRRTLRQPASSWTATWRPCSCLTPT